MIGFFRKLFTKKPVRHPVAGELWYFGKGDGSPWPVKKYPPVTILDVRDGWVRYSFASMFLDERKELSWFVANYKPEIIDSNDK